MKMITTKLSMVSRFFTKRITKRSWLADNCPHLISGQAGMTVDTCLPAKAGSTTYLVELQTSYAMIGKKRRICLILFLFFSCYFSGFSQSLEDYFRIGAEQNPGLISKYKAFEAAMQRVDQVNSLADPNLTLGYFVSPVETRVGPQRMRFSLSQAFPWFGTLGAQENVAKLTAEAKYQEFLDARNNLYFQISAAYFPMVELKKTIELEQRNLDVLKKYKEISTIKFENGTGTMVDVLRTELILEDAETNLKLLLEKEIPLRARFNNLLNEPAMKEVTIQENLDLNPVPRNYRKDSLTYSNPRLEALDLQMKASEANQLAIKKQGLPKLGVGVDYVIIDERTDMVMSDNGKDVLMPMVTMSIPIFRGKYKAAQKEAGLMKEAFALQKDDLENQLTGNYERIAFELRTQAEFLQKYDRQIQLTTQSLELLMRAYSNSGNDYEEVLRMQQELLKYEKQKIEALIKYQISKAELDYITSYSPSF